MGEGVWEGEHEVTPQVHPSYPWHIVEQFLRKLPYPATCQIQALQVGTKLGNAKYGVRVESEGG